eukprot:Sdes_comp18690_c0_seq2m8969
MEDIQTETDANSVPFSLKDHSESNSLNSSLNLSSESHSDAGVSVVESQMEYESTFHSEDFHPLQDSSASLKPSSPEESPTLQSQPGVNTSAGNPNQSLCVNHNCGNLAVSDPCFGASWCSENCLLKYSESFFQCWLSAGGEKTKLLSA